MIGTKGYELAPYGIMQPKDDPAFKKVVDGAVLDMIKNGKVAALYEKYFNSPIPPKQINLKYPMSDAFKRALANRPIRATPRPTSKRLRRRAAATARRQWVWRRPAPKLEADS